MAFLKKLFGRSESAPKLPIHPGDQDLVREADDIWWSTLTLKDCQTMEQQDNTTKVAALTHYIEEDGLSEEEASRQARKSFPAYYGSLEERDNEPLGFGGDDAKLPYVLKDRVNRAVVEVIASMEKSEVRAASSINALIRSLIRSDKI